MIVYDTAYGGKAEDIKWPVLCFRRRFHIRCGESGARSAMQL